MVERIHLKNSQIAGGGIKTSIILKGGVQLH